MGYYPDDYYDDPEALDERALRTLVENHREEYEELLAQAQGAQIEKLQEKTRELERVIKGLKEKVAKHEADKKRWKQRIKSGITERVPE